ncbi:MAG: right-handed parallel beta-helix repeat-containing protein [Sedimentisphaerales bacterium]|nr:right-handed parallel beta-helix repeat-containing protein [Sedimentisphaerales bacterium]
MKRFISLNKCVTVAIILVFASVCIGQDFPYPPTEGQIRIVSWNIEKLGQREPLRTSQQLSDLAQRMLTFEAAIFALQEIFTPSKLETIRSHMGSSWRAYCGGEEYAFLYDETKVELLSANAITNLSNPPYTVYPYDSRRPITVVFRPIGGVWPFRLIDIHCATGQTGSQEGTWLRSKVIEYLEDGGETDQIIILGDYNAWPGKPLFDELVEGNILSTLPHENGDNTSSHLDTTWWPADWFCVTEALKDRVPKRSTFVIRWEHYGETNVEFEATYSDHLPVFADLAVDISFATENGSIENVNNGSRYDHFRHAILEAQEGDLIVAAPGIYSNFDNLDFKGKQLTLRSIDPNDPAVVAATVISSDSLNAVVTFSGGEDSNSVLSGFTITGGLNGIYCYDASPTITNCIIKSNYEAGMFLYGGSNPKIYQCNIIANAGSGIELPDQIFGRRRERNYPEISNCIVAANGLYGIAEGLPTITNCTICDNIEGGISNSSATLTNSIVYFNGDGSVAAQITGDEVTITYSDVQGIGQDGGNIDADPLFADKTNGDYHLMSQAGRWDPYSQLWIKDPLTSPCIDVGSPDSDCFWEPFSNGGCINMGAYGGTQQASRSLIDGKIGWEDFETRDFSSFNWELSGDADWEVVSDEHNSGNSCAKSGLIFDNQTSSLELTLNCAAGNISFYYKVSSERLFDKLIFFIDGLEQGQWSYEQDWTRVTFPVEAGSRVFKWDYVKDESESSGQDSAWLDDIVFPLN